MKTSGRDQAPRLVLEHLARESILTREERAKQASPELTSTCYELPLSLQFRDLLYNTALWLADSNANLGLKMPPKGHVLQDAAVF
ncbi:hypothetical protein U0070_024322 [Myodes glareolus]|uniref:Uncharacterized protein n=1 Tax=Myodes glareolus TaxID=447135 RepID=A0AAW0IL04_MYOGA